MADLRGERGAAFRLAAYSFLILFFELAFIRYVPANVRVFSFYLNLVLIATFVGMGAGLLAVRHVDRLRWGLLPMALILVAATRGFSNVLVRIPRSESEFLWGVYWQASPNVKQIGTLPPVVLLFVCCALFFVPLGALLGHEFRRFRPLVAYSLDILGSLAGIVSFGLLSYVGSPPWLWFVLAFSLLAIASHQSRRYLVAVALTVPLLIVVVLDTAGTNERWSPYYKVNWSEVYAQEFYVIDVNGSMHLTAMEMSSDADPVNDYIARARHHYRLPYEGIPRLDTVLVLGSGAGNDVALLLDMDVEHVDAVEIDPVIASLGNDLHPRHPYDDPRVRLHVDDARAFLRQTSQRYDLVVFGTLDSQTLLSGMSSVRLDNYVYTLEALLDTRAVLKPHGRVLMYHMSQASWIVAKLYQGLLAAFDQPPQVYFFEPHTLFNFVFLTGKGEPGAWRAGSTNGDSPGFTFVSEGPGGRSCNRRTWPPSSSRTSAPPPMTGLISTSGARPFPPTT
ncbi:MAG: hypothetical protein GWN99_20230 [Gemmatimonadetes bacterium]|uniref:Spermidine synthase n=1 Tax=Candidatus Kutchimonas denitrificans TaxID=3056748 RepID=A0AAE5CC09_9BACT|nr:hypothetical protein [Gemmatimonadota bacterium]NIR76532.1 hypothetical protein [Candidatus Kutchimonas denitrificans]NIS03350.1 hypothetical protein [Gemmatimonadota bacterium]NIT69211.1 hypothetical protein [Gemmatimonadota bacterium]NIU54603.1 hypothetical protein [Gemmatimonadota bacterium]